MLSIAVTSFLLSYSITFIQSCTTCGDRDTAGNFHPAIKILFNTTSGDPQISSIGDFNSLTSAIYNEEGILVDTDSSNIRLIGMNLRMKIMYYTQENMNLRFCKFLAMLEFETRS